MSRGLGQNPKAWYEAKLNNMCTRRMNMGKGDQRTKRGKIWRGTSGKTRPKKKKEKKKK
jgi:30S ribosomal protein S31